MNGPTTSPRGPAITSAATFFWTSDILSAGIGGIRSCAAAIPAAASKMHAPAIAFPLLIFMESPAEPESATVIIVAVAGGSNLNLFARGAPTAAECLVAFIA